MMFVIGMNHDNYKKNEELMLKLNEFLNRGYEGLMREPFYGKIVGIISILMRT